MSKVDKLVFLDPDAPGGDPFDTLLNCLKQRFDDPEADIVCLIHRNSENGNVAIFPTTAKSESEWEKRSLAMHAAQQPLPKLVDKPQENVLAKVALERGD